MKKSAPSFILINMLALLTLMAMITQALQETAKMELTAASHCDLSQLEGDSYAFEHN